MDRRSFFKTSVVGAGAVAGLVSTVPSPATAEEAPRPPENAMLKLCSQERLVPGKNTEERLENLKNYGGVGMEFGAMDVNGAKDIKKKCADAGVGVAALCWGTFLLIAPEAETRRKAVDTLKGALDAAAEAGSTGVICVPAFHGDPQLEFYEAKKVLLDLLPEVGAHAAQVGSRVLFEPLNRGEARFLNQLALTAQICRDSGSPGIAMMGDFYHMGIEETSDEGAILSAGPHLHHIHLASRLRFLPGQDRTKEPDKPERRFIDGFRGLKQIGYHDYCSLECTCQGDPAVEIPKSFAFLKSQWEQAAV